MSDATPRPLLADGGGQPSLFEVHSAWLQLEPIVADDEDRFAHAASILEAWVGAELRLANDGFSEDVAYAGLYDWMKRLPLLLDREVSPRPSPVTRMARTRIGYGLACRGGDAFRASPWSVRVRCRIPNEKDRAVSTFVHVTVPTTSSSDDLRTRFLELAGALRVRWGNAALGLSVDAPPATLERCHAHLRAHPGFDVTSEIDPLWDDHLRSVGWLTAIGPGLRGVDLDDPSLAELPDVMQHRLPQVLVLQAGAEPARGNMNRLELPPPYVAVDRALRTARATEGTSFPWPWREDSAEQWLRRFERVVT